MYTCRSVKGFAQLFIALALFMGLTQTGAAQANKAKDYNFFTIDAPTILMGFSETRLSGINERGQIVGQYRFSGSPWFGFLLIDGVFNSLNVNDMEIVNKMEIVPIGINRSGDIVGYARDYNSTATRACLINANGDLTFLFQDTDTSLANGINDKNIVVGQSDAAGYSAFTYSNGISTPIILPNEPNPSAFGINNKGHIVGAAGNDGYVLKDGIFTLIIYENAITTVATGINDSGDIVGVYFTSDSTYAHGFLLSGGTFTSIDYPGAFETFATDVNRSGQIVGRYTDINGTHGFLAEPKKGKQ